MAQICCCGGIFKGSTPSLYFNTNAPLTSVKSMYLTFYQRDKFILEKELKDIIVVDENTIKVKLSQEETLLFSSKYDIAVQLRIKYNENSAVTSEINIFNMKEVLKHEVI
jgi:hypothetical protein